MEIPKINCKKFNKGNGTCDNGVYCLETTIYFSENACLFRRVSSLQKHCRKREPIDINNDYYGDRIILCGEDSRPTCDFNINLGEFIERYLPKELGDCIMKKLRKGAKEIS